MGNGAARLAGPAASQRLLWAANEVDAPGRAAARPLPREEWQQEPEVFASHRQVMGAGGRFGKYR